MPRPGATGQAAAAPGSMLTRCLALPVLLLLAGGGHASALGAASRALQFIQELSHGSRGLHQVDPKNARPKIYIYEMPVRFHNWTEFGDISDSFYGIDQYWIELIKNSPYWTNNTNEADYFTPDVWLYWGPQDVDDVVKEMQKQGPWWDKKGGADHILTVSADPGRCAARSPTISKAIVLHHFGRVGLEGPDLCDLFKMWGGECDRELLNAEAALAKRSVTTCHIPRQDIVVPPSCYEPHPYANAPKELITKPWTQEFKSPYIHPELVQNRTHLLFYSGKIDLHEKEPDAKLRPWSDAGYSFGGRQTLYRMFANHSTMALMNTHTHGSYWERLSSSIFCVAAAGWGWGGRMKVAVTRGCIPIIIQDGIKVEFEEQLPLKEYAIRVPLWLTHKLPDILDAFIKTGRVAKMQKVLDCVWRLHWWRRPHGRAFEVVMCELKRRMLGKLSITVDTEKCTLECGDGVPVPIRDVYNNV